MTPFIRFYWTLFVEALRILSQATYWWVDTLAVVPFILWFVSRVSPGRAKTLLKLWEGISPWYALVPIGLLIIFGIMKANYERFIHIQGERDGLKRQVDDREAKKQVGLALADFVRRIDELRLRILEDDDDSHFEQWDKEMGVLVRQMNTELMQHLTLAKVAYIFGGHSDAVVLGPPMTFRGRQLSGGKQKTIKLLEARLDRLREVLKEY